MRLTSDSTYTNIHVHVHACTHIHTKEIKKECLGRKPSANKYTATVYVILKYKKLSQ